MTAVCKTPRLTIQHFESSDTDFIIKLLNDTDFINNIGDKGVRSTDDASKYLNTGPMASYHINGFGLNKVVLNETQQTIGMCGLLKRPELLIPDLGYAYLPEFRQHGYAKEAAQAILSNAEQQHKISTIAAVTKTDNAQSLALLKKLGFHQLRTIVLYVGESESYYFERINTP